MGRRHRDLLVASPAGAVVLLGSIDGLHGNPHVPAYSIGKGGLVPLTHVLALRLGAHGVRVNCIAAAGLVQTGSGVPPLERTTGVADLARRLTPLGRMPSPDEVAAVAAFFASDDASYVTGRCCRWTADASPARPAPGDGRGTGSVVDRRRLAGEVDHLGQLVRARRALGRQRLGVGGRRVEGDVRSLGDAALPSTSRRGRRRAPPAGTWRSVRRQRAG